QLVNQLELGRIQQQLLLAGTRGRDVDGRVRPAIHQAAIQVKLAVTGAFELLKNHFVHLRARVDQRGADDRQRTALLDVTSRAEEALRLLQGVGVHTAGQNLAGVRNLGI